MALFEYFPNDIWNLSVAIAVESGAQLGEIIDMCKLIKDAAEGGADAGTPQFMKAWAAMGEKLFELAAEDEAKGRLFSASNKLERASLYLITAERMQGHEAPGREATYAKARDTFDRSTRLGRLNRERVEIPLEKARCQPCSRGLPVKAASRWWCSATVSIAARNCFNGRGCVRNWRGVAFQRSASISPVRAKPCACKGCRLIRIRKAGPARRWTGWSSSQKWTPGPSA